jgi:hypothetical protein
MDSVQNFVPIAEYFKAKPEGKQAFDAIARWQTISGWALAKEVSVNSTDELQALLSDLQMRGLIKADGSGLDGFYYLSDLGFRYGSLAS